MTTPKSSLRYHRTALAIAVVYLLILIVPWILTSVLNFRPIWTSKHYSPTFPYDTFDASPGLRRSRPNETLSARGLFALADGRPTLEHSVFNCAYLLLLALALDGQLARSLLVTTETVGITAPATAGYVYHPSYSTIGQDATFAYFPRHRENPVTEKARHDLINLDPQDFQPNLWPNLAAADKLGVRKNYYSWTGESSMSYRSHSMGKFHSFNYQTAADHANLPYFVSVYPNGTSTGMLRSHAARLSSNLTSEAVSVEAFPTKCAGTNPFVRTSHFDTDFLEEELGFRRLNLSICAPGEIKEELWMQMLDGRVDPVSDTSNFTYRCQANTTFGYFELPNYHIGSQPSPLLPKRPDVTGQNHFYEPDKTQKTAVITANNETAVQSVMKALCVQNGIPFSRIFGTPRCAQEGYVNSTLASELGSYAYTGPENTRRTALFFVNRATLTAAAPSEAINAVLRFQARNKVDLVKPSASTAGIAVVSALFRPRPTWTETLDALAISRITHQLRDGGAIAAMGLRPVTGKDKKPLADVDALVGIDDSPTTRVTVNDHQPERLLDDSNSEVTVTDTALVLPPSDVDDTTSGYTPVLRVGTPGVIAATWRLRRKNTSADDA
ncbi:hypothetical protein B0T22DRAFT_440517 [Podospora appendiculata]|uniref:Uncharacterized protein n=1 Tax=Podospora appendiculata TaxID=314037 RepID=A0AAE1CCY5_9PEZI|nr:hypothetical protein B0T22DRAFT_440517 [Podospora appendiculata]